MNSYILSRQWFDFAFENGSKVKPIHGSIYFWLIELANRLGWPAEFGNPGSQCMLACGIGSYNTYKKAFDELAEFGFIQIKRRSINQYSSCIIALSVIDKAQYKALDKALAEHSTKHLQSTIQSTDSINKPQTNKPETFKPSGSSEPKKEFNISEMFEECRKIYPGTKRGLEVELSDFSKKHKAQFSKEFFRAIYKGITLKIITNKKLERAGQFVPEWPHFKTYLYQKRWEEQTEIAKPKSAYELEPKPYSPKTQEEQDELFGGLSEFGKRQREKERNIQINTA